MIAATETWAGVAAVTVTTLGGIVALLIQQGRVHREVRRGNEATERVEQHVNNVEESIGPDGAPQHRTLRQAVDEGFARNEADHQLLIQRIVRGEEHDVIQDGRLDNLDREVGTDD